MKKWLFMGLLLWMGGSCKKEEAPQPFSIDGFDPKLGTANTVVTIQGVGFATTPAENVVKFGGVAATVQTAGQSQLVVVVPVGAKTGKITVETGGRIATSADDFVVPVGPVPVTIKPLSAQEGDEVVITGYNLNNNPSVSFNGVKATQVNSQSNSQLTVTVPDGATTGKITLEANGVTNTSPQDFTVVVPTEAKALVTKLAGIPAYPTAGADGVRMTLATDNKALYITGPGQNTVYKMDLTTLGVAPFQSVPGRPLGIAAYSDVMLVSDRDGYFYTYRFGNFTKTSNGNFPNTAYTVRPNLSGGFIAASFTNELSNVTWSTAGGNTASSYTSSILNSQLKGIPNDANTMLASNGKSMFVFANQTLWKLNGNSLQQVAGSPGQVGYQDGKGASARFQDGGYARGNAIAADGDDNVYVADYGCGCIRKIDKEGNVTTVAGNKNASNRVGRGHRMRFRFDSWDMVISPDGILYVIATNDVSSQTLRNAVYKVTFDK
ncbi:IPT/TIG domain-containing protein [Fibrisoma limi]|nr:IPT/TIG domain-containing protein [Fibrisoma limi]